MTLKEEARNAAMATRGLPPYDDENIENAADAASEVWQKAVGNLIGLLACALEDCEGWREGAIKVIMDNSYD